jgi:hypothetical protein
MANGTLSMRPAARLVVFDNVMISLPDCDLQIISCRLIVKLLRQWLVTADKLR